jgi:uncharacterized Zn-finger protein
MPVYIEKWKEMVNKLRSIMTNTAPEKIMVDGNADEVSCDGGGSLGHPVVWYVFDETGQAECLYCDRLFVKKKD